MLDPSGRLAADAAGAVVGTVAALHRFPVKSMAGEACDELAIDVRGVIGDRMWAVVDADGKLASGKHGRRFRRMDPVFGLRARTGSDGVPLIEGPTGWSRRADEADDLVSAHFGEPVGVRRESTVPYFDAAALSLVGTATLAAAGRLLGENEAPIDVRRFRCNVVVDTASPWVEEEWLGREVAIGSTRIRVTVRTPRCRMVDIPQDGLPRDGRILRTLADRRGMCLAVYADVVRPGVVRTGDPVRLLEAAA